MQVQSQGPRSEQRPGPYERGESALLNGPAAASIKAGASGSRAAVPICAAAVCRRSSPAHQRNLMLSAWRSAFV
jgi:hypothetical protein